MSAETGKDANEKGSNPSCSEDSGKRKLIKGNIFRFNNKPYYIGSSETEDSKEPEIVVNKENEVITGIEIKCVCGRTIHIECN